MVQSKKKEDGPCFLFGRRDKERMNGVLTPSSTIMWAPLLQPYLLYLPMPARSSCQPGGRSSPGVAGSEPRQALLFESVSEYEFPVARVDSRTQEL
jgi:hypothetical protein